MVVCFRVKLSLLSHRLKTLNHSIPFATVDAEEISGAHPAEVQSFVQGKWPLNGEPFIKVAEVQESGVQPFIESLAQYIFLYGHISTKAANMLALPKVSDFFTRLIQRVAPKSYQQAEGEVFVTRKFLENFCGDQVWFLARSFAVPGNHPGHQSHGYRWPYGPVTIVTPFNFPLEIPLLQLMGALYMGNKPLLKVDIKVSIVMEKMMRLLHYCGLPVEDVDFINSDGKTMNKILLEANPRMTLFTGSSRVAEKLALDLKVWIRLEDAGFDWKVLGPDVIYITFMFLLLLVSFDVSVIFDPMFQCQVDFVAWVCDQDAYAWSGQKCSAQSMLFVHEGGFDLTELAKNPSALQVKRSCRKTCVSYIFIAHVCNEGKLPLYISPAPVSSTKCFLL
ncbi:Aldehyde dehydrogenase domain-containing protein [Hirschfeldia incana]|nr:Aldehyde dehydrogenase domain-containing protein [Hirschfeldia incana]